MLIVLNILHLWVHSISLLLASYNSQGCYFSDFHQFIAIYHQVILKYFTNRIRILMHWIFSISNLCAVVDIGLLQLLFSCLHLEVMNSFTYKFYVGVRLYEMKFLLIMVIFSAALLVISAGCGHFEFYLAGCWIIFTIIMKQKIYFTARNSDLLPSPSPFCSCLSPPLHPPSLSLFFPPFLSSFLFLFFGRIWCIGLKESSFAFHLAVD